MIPKIIHYCWLSDNKYPETIQKCMDTWKEKLPDYEFVHWDTNRFDLESNLWVNQAFKSGKYAFAADYIRLYAVYNYGGIYLDTDIEVIKDFDDLLSLPYFVGSEGEGIIEAGVFGAEKNTQWIQDCLSYYDNKSFINHDGTLNTLPLPRIMMAQIRLKGTIVELSKNEIFERLSNGANDSFVYMFGKDFFCAKNLGTGAIEKTANTYSIHHFAKSWISKKHKFLPDLKRKMMGFFGVEKVNALIHFFRLKEIKDQFLKK